MKKSNNLGGTNPWRQHAGHHWTPLKHSEGQELERILRKAMYLEREYGRKEAIQWLQRNRAWLAEYFRHCKDIPASGELLDSYKRRYE